MKRILLLFLFALTLVSCSESAKHNLTISGAVNGLKKGTLYLEKINDTTVVTLDSIVMKGASDFNFTTTIDEPEMLYLYLKKTDNVEQYQRIDFFAEPGVMTINTSLKNFETDAVITGSKNQQKLEEHYKLLNRYNDRLLDIIKANFEAQQQNNNKLADSLKKQERSINRAKYLATVNFAIKNNDMAIAPYLALNQIYDVNIKYLDTIYTSLNPEIKTSKYGKLLDELRTTRRDTVSIQ